MEMSGVASNFNHESPSSDFLFLLIPKFSMLALSGVLEPLRMANRLAGRELYRWRLLSMDDTPVPASNDMKFAPTARLDEAHQLDTLIVVASIDTVDYCTPKVLPGLRQIAVRGEIGRASCRERVWQAVLVAGVA